MPNESSKNENIVARTDELKDGEMKQVSVNGTDVLLARVSGQFHALPAHCPHYGGELAKGALHGDRVVCPLHHACFNVTTGDLQEPPALDSLPCFNVRVENENVIVTLPEEVTDRRTPAMAKKDSADDNRVFVILGGGAAGYVAAQTLREDGFAGRIVMITREQVLPYDRPNLSKEYLEGKAEPEWMPLRPDDFYSEHDIEIMRGKTVTQVDSAKRKITFSDGENFQYDKLLVATGGEPRRLDIPGSDLKNIFVMRSMADTDAIVAKVREGGHGVVIGASFIGMECAASLTERKLSVTVIAPDDVPFKKTLGPEIGGLMLKMHQSHGVQFKLGAKTVKFEGDGVVKTVVLDSGERIDADLVVVGVGVRPLADFLQGINLHKDGGVIVDKHLLAADGVYAAGDIAWFPSAATGELQRIEHWRTAEQQGRIAAHNMAGKTTEYDSVPFFWTRQFGVGLSYVGHATGWDEIVFQGELDSQKFLAFYVKDNNILAVAGMNNHRNLAAIEELMRVKRMPTVAEIKNGKADFPELLK